MIQEHYTLTVSVVAGIASVFVVQYLKSPWRKLPPGPPGLPIIGNALQLTGEQWLKYSAWRKEYGDILYLNAAGLPMVILNSPKVAAELLDRRAAIYSDRPSLIVACEILCDGLALPLARYNETWRRMRKAAHEALNKVVAHGLNDYQSEEALVLARNGLSSSTEWDTHIRSYTASMMLRCLYDQSPVSDELDSRVQHINDFALRVSAAASPGAYWVELMPWMRHVPSFLAPWKRIAEEWNRKDSQAFGGYFDCVQKELDAGTGQSSLCANLIHESDRYRLSAREKSWLAAGIYAAGTDTTRAALSWWTLAIVIGRARVPSFADMPHLPYICAMVKEVLRWRPMTPFGLPHQNTEDDFYDGYFIPKGTVVIANVWEMNRDPAIFGQDARHFNPSRYLDEKGQLLLNLPGSKDGHYSFGFGRRICVGRHVANNSLFIDIATCLWAFCLANTKDQELDVDGCVDEGLVVVPKPFEVKIRPRFPEAFPVISQECELRGR